MAKRLPGGSGSVGRLILGETSGVMVREGCLGGSPEDEALEALDSGLTGLKVNREAVEAILEAILEAVIVSSEGGNGAWGRGGVAEVGRAEVTGLSSVSEAAVEAEGLEAALI